MSFVTHLECALCGTRHDSNTLQNLCASCQRPLWVKYDLAAVGKNFSKASLNDRPATIWRYRELLPIKQAPISLGESMTKAASPPAASKPAVWSWPFPRPTNLE